MPAWQQLASLRAPSTSQMPSARVPPMAPPPAEMLDAGAKLRRAEHLCEREDYGAALRLANELVAEDSRVADHHALRAWVQYHTWVGEKIPRNLADSVTDALKLDPDNVRALYVKGLIYKRTGKDRECRRYFARVVELDPSHVDAQRELRLARRRAGK
jgi:tetratricopeptide (TPR) repeat protein